MINKRHNFLLVLFSLFLAFSVHAQKKDFVLVLDAGHGGKDGGARGILQNEKTIALDVTLRVGEKIKKEFKDVKVIYTRSTDVFIPLWKRAAIANQNDADLFVSIHCNSATRKGAYGTETFVMGLSRMDENLEVINRENSVISLEDNSQERYQKFDPNSPESVITFKLMHAEFQDQSLRMAQFVEDSFTQIYNRFSRGVKQANFHVLRENARPSVLVELGFISNQEEGRYLSSDKGKKEASDAVFQAFKKYKEDHDYRSGKGIQQEKEVKPKEPEKPVVGFKYKIQILTSKRKYNATSPQMRGLQNVEVLQVGDYFKYYYGETNLNSKKDELLEFVKRKGFRDAFPVEFPDDKKLEKGQEYRIQFLTSNKKYRGKKGEFRGLNPDLVFRLKEDGLHRYYFSKAVTYEDAQKLLADVRKKGFRDAFIVTFKDGEKL